MKGYKKYLKVVENSPGKFIGIYNPCVFARKFFLERRSYGPHLTWDIDTSGATHYNYLKDCKRDLRKSFIEEIKLRRRIKKRKKELRESKKFIPRRVWP